MEHIDGTLEEQKQGLPISSISSTFQDAADEEDEEETEKEDADAVASSSRKPMQMTSVGSGMTDVSGRYVVQSSL